ncbi:MAG TPA: sugar phosphate isomerase/epimerase family protein [Bryobacteraceae bacterium]|nr:sugar phosphate isomerase/epimerase family protein [Bryobacteraceae bacterium]
MYLSLNPAVVAGRVPWPEFARLAAKVGFPGVDVDLVAARKAGLPATNALLDDLRIKPAAINLPVEFRKDDAVFARDLAQLADAASFATAISCPRMITWLMPSSKTPKVELRALYLKRFRAVADVLARSHVRLGLEFLGPLHLRRQEPYEFIWRMPEMLAFARECGPNVGLLLDVWHWHHAGATTADIVKAGKDAIVHVHFNDAPKLPPDQIRDDQRLMPGDGVINLNGFLMALHEIGYQDALSVEVFGRFLKDMTPEAAARRALESSRAVMQKAGVNA